MSYSGRGGGGGNKGTVSYLLEDSWPRLYIVLGWTAKDGDLQILLSIADTHLQYDDLLKTELNSLAIKVIFCRTLSVSLLVIRTQSAPAIDDVTQCNSAN